jgi:hypothetical protein
MDSRCIFIAYGVILKHLEVDEITWVSLLIVLRGVLTTFSVGKRGRATFFKTSVLKSVNKKKLSVLNHSVRFSWYQNDCFHTRSFNFEGSSALEGGPIEIHHLCSWGPGSK